MRSRLFVVGVAGLSALLLAAGCDTAPKSRSPKTGGSARAGGGPGGAQAAPPAGVDVQPSALPAGGPALRAADTAVLGRIVVDGKGMTVYRFEKDTAQPPRSNCTAACATQWLPVPYTADMKIEGIDQKLIGSVPRADGTAQVTLAGWPVYRFSGDAKPGDIKGQGKDGVWFAFAPNGSRIGGPPPPAAKSSGGGY
jgi:predicted lipoprotein with Yx(FWY)xxD motif